MNINQMIKQAQQMQRRVDKVKKEYDEKEFEFSSQQDIVTGVIKGSGEITKLSINKEYLTEDNLEMLEDVLIVTVNENVKKVTQEKEKLVNNITNGVDVSAFL